VIFIFGAREDCVRCNVLELLASCLLCLHPVRFEGRKGKGGEFLVVFTEYTQQKPAPADGAFTGDANATKVKRDKCKQDIFQK
jgi:hypothetical protein